MASILGAHGLGSKDLVSHSNRQVDMNDTLGFAFHRIIMLLSRIAFILKNSGRVRPNPPIMPTWRNSRRENAQAGRYTSWIVFHVVIHLFAFVKIC